MTLAAFPIGLARLPKAIRALLAQAAADAVAAANALDHDAHDPPPQGVVAEPGPGTRAELRRAIARERSAGPERGELLAVMRALEELRTSIDTAHRARAASGSAVPLERLTAITGIIRDLTRTTATSVLLVERDAAARESLHARAHELRDELRVVLRSAHAAIASDGNDPLASLQGNDLLRRLRATGDANTHAMQAIELLASQQ